jgi:hypothetical protein
MNVRDLKRFLEDVDEDLEVRFASQPNWPFEYEIDDIVIVDLNVPEDFETDEERETVESAEVVYLVEGIQLDYLPGVVREAVGW